MQTMRVSLLVQVVLAALTLGACLGAILPRLPDLAAVRAVASGNTQPTPAAYALASANDLAASNAATVNSGITSDLPAAGASLQVQVRAEVQAAGNANAEAQALGPGNTQAKANTLGPGSSQAVAYTTNPESTDSVAPTQPSSAQATMPLDSATTTIPTSYLAASRALVRETLANMRSGPGTHYTVVGIATQGQQFTPVARTIDGNWWKVCCHNQQPLWLSGQVAEIYGQVENIEVVAASPAPVVVAPVPTIPPSPPPPTAVPGLPPVPPPQSYEFGLTEKNQFAESVTPRIFLYIAQGAEGLGGYTLQVKKDNTYLPINIDTFNGPPAFTWPLSIDRQRFYNLKIEFPGVEPAGTWEVQVIEDSSRKVVAAPVIFNLAPNDPRQEMYISLRR